MRLFSAPRAHSTTAVSSSRESDSGADASRSNGPLSSPLLKPASLHRLLLLLLLLLLIQLTALSLPAISAIRGRRTGPTALLLFLAPRADRPMTSGSHTSSSALLSA